MNLVRIALVVALVPACAGLGWARPVATHTIGAPVGDVAPLLGVNMGPLPAGEAGNADLTEAYKRLGVTLIRTHDFTGPFDLADVFPDPAADPDAEGVLRFEATDRAFAAIRDNGFGLYLRLGDSWRNGRAGVDPDRLVRAMVRMVGRYRDGMANTERPLRYVEVWNEPDNRQFWKGSREEWYALYVKAAKAIDAAYPELQVGGPAVTPAGAITPQGQAFVAGFLAEVKEAGAPLDFLSWHMYANDPATFADAAATYREALEEAGFGDLPQHVTEWNTSYRAEGRRPPRGGGPGGRGARGGGPREGGPGGREAEDLQDVEVRTGAKASALTTASWIAMQQAGVDEALFYRGPDPSADAPFFHGLFYADGRPKPAGLAFELWRAMVEHPTRLEVKPDRPEGEGVWALAGRAKDGSVAVLLANVSATPAPWRIGLPKGTKAGTVRVRSVAGTAERIEEATLKEAAGTLPAWAVALVEIAAGGR